MFLLPVVEQEMVRIKLLRIRSPQLLVPMNRYSAHNDGTSGWDANAICRGAGMEMNYHSTGLERKQSN